MRTRRRDPEISVRRSLLAPAPKSLAWDQGPGELSPAATPRPRTCLGSLPGTGPNPRRPAFPFPSFAPASAPRLNEYTLGRSPEVTARRGSRGRGCGCSRRGPGQGQARRRGHSAAQAASGGGAGFWGNQPALPPRTMPARPSSECRGLGSLLVPSSQQDRE